MKMLISSMKMRLKMLSAKWRPLCLGLNVLSNLGEIGRNNTNGIKGDKAETFGSRLYNLYDESAVHYNEVT